MQFDRNKIIQFFKILFLTLLIIVGGYLFVVVEIPIYSIFPFLAVFVAIIGLFYGDYFRSSTIPREYNVKNLKLKSSDSDKEILTQEDILSINGYLEKEKNNIIHSIIPGSHSLEYGDIIESD